MTPQRCLCVHFKYLAEVQRVYSFDAQHVILLIKSITAQRTTELFDFFVKQKIISVNMIINQIFFLTLQVPLNHCITFIELLKSRNNELLTVPQAGEGRHISESS